jgi:hypothetical protein
MRGNRGIQARGSSGITVLPASAMGYAWVARGGWRDLIEPDSILTGAEFADRVVFDPHPQDPPEEKSMKPRICLLITCLAVSGALIAGCGSSSSSSSATPASSTPAAPSSTPAAPTSTPAIPNLAAAVAACKAGANRSPLSADLKAKLLTICDQAASGNQAGVRKAAAQVCVEIVKATVPAAAQTQALATCPKV